MMKIINLSGEVRTPMPPTAMGTGSYFITDSGDDHDVELYRFDSMEEKEGRIMIHGTRIPDLKKDFFYPEDIMVVEIDDIHVRRKGVECLGVPVDSMMMAAGKLSSGNVDRDPEITKVVDMLIKMANEAKDAAQ